MMLEVEKASSVRAATLEHQILDHLKQALRVTADWKAPTVGLPRKVASLQFVAKSLFRHLQRMMDLEERDGYLSVVGEQKPNLDDRIRKLSNDHTVLRGRIVELEPAIETLSERIPNSVDAICEELLGLLVMLDQHDEDEIDLLQESMLFDEGGEG